MSWIKEISNKLQINLLVYFVVLFSLSSCEEYISLFPTSYTGGANYEIINYDLFLMGNDTMKICANTTGIEGDSTLYVFIKIQLKEEDKGWENDSLYYIVDSGEYRLKPYSVRKFDKDLNGNNFNYEYRIMFYTGEEIKLPVKFNITDLNNNKHVITFNLEKIE